MDSGVLRSGGKVACPACGVTCGTGLVGSKERRVREHVVKGQRCVGSGATVPRPRYMRQPGDAPPHALSLASQLRRATPLVDEGSVELRVLERLAEDGSWTARQAADALGLDLVPAVRLLESLRGKRWLKRAPVERHGGRVDAYRLTRKGRAAAGLPTTDGRRGALQAVRAAAPSGTHAVADVLLVVVARAFSTPVEGLAARVGASERETVRALDMLVEQSWVAVSVDGLGERVVRATSRGKRAARRVLRAATEPPARPAPSAA